MVKSSLMLFNNKRKNVWLNEVSVFIFLFAFFHGVAKNNKYYRIATYFKV